MSWDSYEEDVCVCVCLVGQLRCLGIRELAQQLVGHCLNRRIRVSAGCSRWHVGV